MRTLACLILLPISWAGAQTPSRASRLWSLRPVQRPDVPEGLTASSNPIDAFIAEQYRAKGLKPNGKADRPTLLRRVTLDLTGLPPTPAEQDAFLADTSDQAWNKVVDRLLADEIGRA